jgi:hypothetical protein
MNKKTLHYLTHWSFVFIPYKQIINWWIEVTDIEMQTDCIEHGLWTVSIRLSLGGWGGSSLL